jgi:hypothetical protein
MAAWSQLLEQHRASVDAFTTCAECIPGRCWDAPRAPGKWTPAQETEHIRLAYVLFIRAFRDGYRARPMVSRRWATLLRWTVMPAIRVLGWFPSGARSPHDARPATAPGRQDLLVAQVRAQAAAFEALILALREADPARRAYHPYFGDMGLREMVALANGHTRHHLGHLAPLVPVLPVRQESSTPR